MDSVLCGLSNVTCYLDDVLIGGKDFDECYVAVEAVLTKFRDYGIRVRKDKCRFFESSVTYLGHVIDSSGVHPTDDKIMAIKNVPEPESVTQLRAYLGMLNFYGKFIPNLSTELSPLYQLLRKGAKWQWSADAREAFEKSKTWLTKDSVLTFYDPSVELGLVCDASA